VLEHIHTNVLVDTDRNVKTLMHCVAVWLSSFCISCTACYWYNLFQFSCVSIDF